MSVDANSVALMVTCHPSSHSRCAQVATRVLEVLRRRGIKVIHEDLVASGFAPVLSLAELSSYYEDGIPGDLTERAAHLKEATDLIFVFPIWMFDMPALLKGYFERVFRPNVAFRFVGNDIVPLLTHIRRMTVIVTHGRSEAETKSSGDSSVSFFARSLPSLLPGLVSNNRFDLYDLDRVTSEAFEARQNAISQHFT